MNNLYATYISHFKEMLKDTFDAIRKGENVSRESRGLIIGYMKGGRVLGVTYEKLQTVVEEQIYLSFRQKATLDDIFDNMKNYVASDKLDYEMLEIPTFKRKICRIGKCSSN